MLRVGILNNFLFALVSFFVASPFVWLSTLVAQEQSRVSQQLKSQLKGVEYCQLEFLESLGWSFNESKTGALEVHSGNPCDDETLEISRKAGELSISIPSNPTKAQVDQISSKLSSLAGSDASNCAYKFVVRTGLRRATEKLIKRTEMDLFSFVRKGDSSCGYQGGTGWKTREDEGYFGCLFASGPPSKAIQCIYETECRADCLLGRQILSLAGQYELYGPEQFDRAFKSSDVAVGKGGIILTDNPFEGAGLYIPHENSWQQLVPLGPLALVGMVGIIANVKGEEFLDSPNDRNENFVIIDMSAKAAKALSSNDLGFYNKKNQEIWQHFTETGKVDELSDVFYTETQIYVHPLGVMTLGQHIERLLHKNPRTPYRFDIKPDRQMTTLFNRYHDFHINDCLARQSTKR